MRRQHHVHQFVQLLVNFIEMYLHRGNMPGHLRVFTVRAEDKEDELEDTDLGRLCWIMTQLLQYSGIQHAKQSGKHVPKWQTRSLRIMLPCRQKTRQ